MSARRHHSQPSSAERDDEVGVVVVVGDRQPERVVSGQPAVERVLGIDVQRALEAEHAAVRAPSATFRRSGARFVIAS